MNTKEAIDILEYHELWLKGKNTQLRYTQKQISEALNLILKNKNKYTIEDIEKCVEHWGLCKVEKEYIENFLLKKNDK